MRASIRCSDLIYEREGRESPLTDCSAVGLESRWRAARSRPHPVTRRWSYRGARESDKTEEPRRARSISAPSPPLLHRTLITQSKHEACDEQHVRSREPCPAKRSALLQSHYAVGSRQQSAPDDERSIAASVVHRPADRALIYNSRQLRARGHKPTRARRGCLVEKPDERHRKGALARDVARGNSRSDTRTGGPVGSAGSNACHKPSHRGLYRIRPGSDGRPLAKSLERERLRGFVVVRLHLSAEV